MNNTQALWEAVKEFFRVVLLAVIPILIHGFQTNTLDWRLIGVTAIIAGLKAIDKGLHKSDSRMDGLAPF